MTRTAAVVIIACASLATALDAQPMPDFSGTWVLDEHRSGSATHEAFVGPVVWTITQSSDAVLLERRRGDGTLSFSYPIRTNANPAPVAPTAEAPGHRGYWDGTRLILETHQNVQGKTVTTRETLMLSGQELVAERVLEVEHGYTLRGAQNYSAVKDVFTRRAP
jgi:hypothetical protein